MFQNDEVQEKRGTGRNSSIELLRIISMFVIVAYHYSLHGGYDKFSAYKFSGGVLFVQLLGLFGKVACSVFALISGYYLAVQKGSLKEQYKRILPLYIEMHFYYLVILVFVLATKLVPISPALWIKSLFPLIFGTWYIKYYILLLLFSPFLGTWLRSLDKRSYQKLVILVIILWSVVQTFSNAAWDFGEMDFFFVMYLIGGYLKLYMNSIPPRKKTGILSFAFIFLMIASVIVFDFVGLQTGIKQLIDYATYFRRYDTVLALGCAVSVFLFSLGATFYNGIINKVASATLGIYLIHNNALIDTYIWKVLYPNSEYIYNPYFHAVVKIVGVFSISLIIELFRQVLLEQRTREWIDRNYAQIWQAIRRIVKEMIIVIDKVLD